MSKYERIENVEKTKTGKNEEILKEHFWRGIIVFFEQEN